MPCAYLEGLKPLPATVKLQADCMYEEKHIKDAGEMTCNDLRRTWYRKQVIKDYESELGSAITFSNMSLTNHSLINFEFKLAIEANTNQIQSLLFLVMLEILF